MHGGVGQLHSPPAARTTAGDPSADAVLLVDRGYRILFANHAAAILCPSSGMRIGGRLLWEVLPWTASVLMRRELRYATEERAETEFEEQDLRNARRFQVRARHSPAGLLLVVRKATRSVAERGGGPAPGG